MDYSKYKNFKKLNVKTIEKRWYYHEKIESILFFISAKEGVFVFRDEKNKYYSLQQQDLQYLRKIKYHDNNLSFNVLNSRLWFEKSSELPYFDILERYKSGSYRGEDSGARYPEYSERLVCRYDVSSVAEVILDGISIKERVRHIEYPPCDYDYRGIGDYTLYHYLLNHPELCVTGTPTHPKKPQFEFED